MIPCTPGRKLPSCLITSFCRLSHACYFYNVVLHQRSTWFMACPYAFYLWVSMSTQHFHMCTYWKVWCGLIYIHQRCFTPSLYIFIYIVGCERAFNRPDKLREHITKHTSLNPISKAAGNSAANVVLLTKSNKASNDMDAMLCRYCQNDRFETAEQLHEHEDLCIQVPRIVSIVMWVTEWYRAYNRIGQWLHCLA